MAIQPVKKNLVSPVTTGHALPISMRSAVVETRFTPVQDLLTHIPGGRVTCTWFSQTVRQHDHLRPQDIELEPAQQSYNRIEQFEFRQQGDMSHSIAEGNKEADVTGEGITYPGFVPNDGDMIIMDIGQGQWGICAVVNATPLSIYKQTCYRFTFSLRHVQSDQHLKDLERKTNETFHFVTDFLRAGKNPIVVDSEYANYRSLDRLFMTMVSDYFRTFFSEVNQTLVIPNQEGGAYDPFLVKAVLSILEVTQHPVLKKLQKHALDISFAHKVSTIWDALLNVEPSYLYLSVHRMGLVGKNTIKDRGVWGGLYWTRIQHLMCPIDSRNDADVQFTSTVNTSKLPLKDAGVPIADMDRLVLNNADTVNMPLVDDSKVKPPVARQIPNANEDSYYVFTRAFYYQENEHMSELETMVWSFLNHNEIDVNKLVSMVDSSRRWDKLERFYFVPVLMLLCVVAFRGPSHG